VARVGIDTHAEDVRLYDAITGVQVRGLGRYNLALRAAATAAHAILHDATLEILWIKPDDVDRHVRIRWRVSGLHRVTKQPTFLHDALSTLLVGPNDLVVEHYIDNVEPIDEERPAVCKQHPLLGMLIPSYPTPSLAYTCTGQETRS
jgi:hypothetical protein